MARFSSTDNKIVAVGTTDEVARHELLKRGPVEEIDCRGKVVLPGFVDSHTHPVFTAPRLVDFRKAHCGRQLRRDRCSRRRHSRQPARRARVVDGRNSPATSLRALDEMAAQGTTTVEAKSGYGLSFEAEIKSLEAIADASRQWPGTVVPTLLGAHVVAPEYRDDPEEYVRIVCEEMIPAERPQRKLAEFVDVFCERGAFIMQQSQRILRAPSITVWACAPMSAS